MGTTARTEAGKRLQPHQQRLSHRLAHVVGTLCRQVAGDWVQPLARGRCHASCRLVWLEKPLAHGAEVGRNGIAVALLLVRSTPLQSFCVCVQSIMATAGPPTRAHKVARTHTIHKKHALFPSGLDHGHRGRVQRRRCTPLAMTLRLGIGLSERGRGPSAMPSIPPPPPPSPRYHARVPAGAARRSPCRRRTWPRPAKGLGR
jgi:hypothetical protein